MILTIGNKLRLTNIQPDLRAWFIDHLTYPNPEYQDAVRHGRSTYNIPPLILMYEDAINGVVVPRGFLYEIEEALINTGRIREVFDERVIRKPFTVVSSIELWPLQAEAKQGLVSRPNGMLIAPAASGKTVMGLDLFTTFGQKTLWLTHTDRLADQVVERILGDDKEPPMLPDMTKKEIGRIGGGKATVGDRFTVGMIQTFARRPQLANKLSKEFGMVIVDEAHHVPAATFLRVVGYFYSYYLYGLTATPYRRDGLENIMYASMGGELARIDRKDVRDAGDIITPTLVKRVVPMPPIDGNDYHELLEYVMGVGHRLKMIVDDVVREAQAEHYCIVISTRKAYCEMLAEGIKEYWPKTGIATGDYTRKHNNEQVEKLENNEITVLVTTFELLGEGFDVKKLDRGFITLPFRERSRVEQAVGRIQRSCDGKDNALLFDYVDENIGLFDSQFSSRLYAYRGLGLNTTTR
jgi:superfamily II DNA or RNA helicase